MRWWKKCNEMSKKRNDIEIKCNNKFSVSNKKTPILHF